MSLVINTNTNSLVAQKNLDKSQSSLSTSMQRLSSGLRINSAKDDAAGLAISQRMTSQINGLDQAQRNANDGISVAQVAEGAMQESSNLIQRIRELAIQSANDSNSDTDRQNIQKEVSQLQSELTRISETTTFNGKKLLDGSFTSQLFQVGTNANETISVSVKGTSSATLGAQKVSGEANAGALTAAAAASTAAASTANGVTAETLAITGSSGSASVAVVAGDAASDIAAAVNNLSASSGVTATASNSVELTAIPAGGTLTFSIASTNNDGVVGSSVNISVNVPTANDISSLRDSINQASTQTGISAALNDTGDGIVLTNTTGDNIVINDFASSTAGNQTITVGGATVTEGSTDSISVGGKVTFSSTESYSVVAGTAGNVLTNATTNSTLSSVAAIDVSTRQGSNDALDVLDAALQTISSNRADLGAIQNRLDSTISNLSNITENVTSARSRVQDADFAAETANMSTQQILQQAGISVLSQANSLQQQVLTLLQ